MDLGSIFVTLAIVIIVVGYIARPLIENRGYAVTEPDHRLSTLQAQRDQILTVLQELDMDHAMGKVQGEDYEAQRSVLVSRGAAVLKELDLLAGVGVQTDGHIDQGEFATRKLEGQIEDAVSQMRRDSSKLDSNFCSHCGSALESGDQFCSNCGTAIKVGEV
jgi:hypothetical protein